jgi:hypothetical protein
MTRKGKRERVHDYAYIAVKAGHYYIAQNPKVGLVFCTAEDEKG